MLTAIESKLIFFPSVYPEGDWQQGFEDVEFTTDDGVPLHGWYCLAEPGGSSSRPVLLYSHGNAGNLTSRADAIRVLMRELDVDFFIYDYRGYGKSGGRPSERGLYIDGRAAYHWLTKTRGVGPERIVLFGRSLGGAVALELGLHVAHRCLFLESTFTSMPDVAGQLYPWLPARAIMRTRFANLQRIGNYHQPVLITHGAADDLVRVDHARKLFAAANEPKTLYEIPHAGHNDTLLGGQPYFETLRTFLRDAFAE